MGSPVACWLSGLVMRGRVQDLCTCGPMGSDFLMLGVRILYMTGSQTQAVLEVVAEMSAASAQAPETVLSLIAGDWNLLSAGEG